MTPAKVFSGELIEILTASLQSPVPITLKEMPFDFIKVGLYREHFQKNVETLFRDRYSTKNYEPLYH